MVSPGTFKRIPIKIIKFYLILLKCILVEFEKESVYLVLLELELLLLIRIFYFLNKYTV